MKKNKVGLTKSMGIQTRIFLMFLLFIAILLFLLWFFQIRFLDFFYRREIEKNMQVSSGVLSKNIEHSECSTLVERFAEEQNICILIVDEKMDILYSEEGFPNCIIHHLSRRDLRRMLSEENGKEELRFFTMPRFVRPSLKDKHFEGPLPIGDEGNTHCLISIQKTVSKSTGKTYYVFQNTVLSPVYSTVTTIKSELVVISCLLILIGFILSYVLSRQISKPIVQITNNAKELSNFHYESISLKGNYREVVELNSQLIDTAKDLDKVNAMQKELIANISHDLRTPLTLIEGYVEVMKDIPGEMTAENLQTVQDETRRLTSLVNAVLEFSKSTQVENTEMENFNLSKSVREIIKRYSQLMSHDGYEIRFEHGQDVWVCSHPLKISQIIYNLINNALTYTGQDKLVIIRQTTADGKVKLEIIDSGEGIPKEELPYIWDRYYRGSGKHVRPAAGTGLGLNIAREIMNSYHIQYGVESEKDKGSNFWFILPAVEPQEE